MTDKNEVDVDILAEDNRLASFCLRIVEKLGIQKLRRRIRVLPVPKTGAGYTWLYKQYPEQVARHRQRAKLHNVVFVVGLDSDETSIAERIRALDKKLEEAEMGRRQNKERIVMMIPKRNIETWVKHFEGERINEEIDYKDQVKKPDFKNAATAFVAEFHQYRAEPGSVQTLASLAATYEELRRVLP